MYLIVFFSFQSYELFNNIFVNLIWLFQTMYIMKSLIHLSGMYLFGERSWKPWFISLTIEYIR